MSTRFIYLETDDPQAVVQAMNALGLSIAPALAAPPAALPPVPPTPEVAQLPEPEAIPPIRRPQKFKRKTPPPQNDEERKDARLAAEDKLLGMMCGNCGEDAPEGFDRRAACPKCRAYRRWEQKAPPRKEL